MKFKDVAISDASTEAKVAALAVLLDKELLKLAETVLNVQKIQGPQGEQGLQGPKGEQGDRGFDGTNGKDGSDGKDGKDGEAGKQGVGVQDAKIDFDGSLVITLTDGTEINAGEIVPLDTAEKIRVIGNGGGTSQSVLDAIEAIQATIATYGTMALQNKTSVDIEGGTIDGTTVGSTTPAAGTFTALSTGTLTATGQTSLGGAAGSESLRVLVPATAGSFMQVQGASASAVTVRYTNDSGSNVGVAQVTKGTGSFTFATNNSTSTAQFLVAHTASAVNYVQVTGAATAGSPAITTQGSDTNVGLTFNNKGAGSYTFQTNGTTRLLVNAGGTVSLGYTNGNPCLTTTGQTSQVNGLQVLGAAAGSAPVLSSIGSDTNIDIRLTPKGTGNVRFGTYTASMALTVQGYIEIKDSGGTVRKLAVIA